MTWDVTDAFRNLLLVQEVLILGYNTLSDSLCLTDGCYVLNVYDSYGDGWSTGQLGSVTLADGTKLLHSWYITYRFNSFI